MATECIRIKQIASVDAGILKVACTKIVSLKGFSLEHSNADQTKLKFKTGMSFFSWGETIDVDINNAQYETRLEIRSRCVLST